MRSVCSHRARSDARRVHAEGARSAHRAVHHTCTVLCTVAYERQAHKCAQVVCAQGCTIRFMTKSKHIEKMNTRGLDSWSPRGVLVESSWSPRGALVDSWSPRGPQGWGQSRGPEIARGPLVDRSWTARGPLVESFHRGLVESSWTARGVHVDRSWTSRPEGESCTRGPEIARGLLVDRSWTTARAARGPVVD